MDFVSGWKKSSFKRPLVEVLGLYVANRYILIKKLKYRLYIMHTDHLAEKKIKICSLKWHRFIKNFAKTFPASIDNFSAISPELRQNFDATDWLGAASWKTIPASLRKLAEGISNQSFDNQVQISPESIRGGFRAFCFAICKQCCSDFLNDHPTLRALFLILCSQRNEWSDTEIIYKVETCFVRKTCWKHFFLMTSWLMKNMRRRKP